MPNGYSKRGKNGRLPRPRAHVLAEGLWKLLSWQQGKGRRSPANLSGFDPVLCCWRTMVSHLELGKPFLPLCALTWQSGGLENGALPWRDALLVSLTCTSWCSFTVLPIPAWWTPSPSPFEAKCQLHWCMRWRSFSPTPATVNRPWHVLCLCRQNRHCLWKWWLAFHRWQLLAVLGSMREDLPSARKMARDFVEATKSRFSHIREIAFSLQRWCGVQETELGCMPGAWRGRCFESSCAGASCTDPFQSHLVWAISKNSRSRGVAEAFQSGCTALPHFGRPRTFPFWKNGVGQKLVPVPLGIEDRHSRILSRNHAPISAWCPWWLGAGWCSRPALSSEPPREIAREIRLFSWIWLHCWWHMCIPSWSLWCASCCHCELLNEAFGVFRWTWLAGKPRKQSSGHNAKSQFVIRYCFLPKEFN